jgi:hypothetical protein
MNEIKTVERKVRFLSMGLVLLSLAWTATLIRSLHTADLVVRRLAIVDAKGVERVVLSAPVPDAIVLGKRLKRDGQASGIILYDGAGNERGGYLTSDEDSNGAMLTLDGADGTQVVTIYANAKGGASLSLDNERGDGASLISWRRPSVQLREGKTVIFKQPADAPDSH